MKPAHLLFLVLALAALFALLAATSRPSYPSGIAPRGVFGDCPGGFVDHPADPTHCVLPVLAQRYLAVRARPRREIPPTVDPWEARRQADAAARAHEDATREAVDDALRRQAEREAAETALDY